MDEQLLIRFLTHTCTPEDLRSIDQWIASGKPNADWLFEMERIWSLKDELRFSDRREIEEAYNRFTLSQGKSKNAKPHFYIYPILKYAAAVIIIGLLGLNLYKMVQPATVGENTVEVPKGQRASLMLSDGTKIWLNSQSKLIYPTQFSDKERNVRLEGEAFFDVAHKEHLPFVVHSPLLAIKVLGTKFNVKAYFDEKSVVTFIIRKTKCFDFWERNVLFPKTKRSFFRTPTPLPCPFPLNFSLLIITKKFGNLAKNRYICIV